MNLHSNTRVLHTKEKNKKVTYFVCYGINKCRFNKLEHSLLCAKEIDVYCAKCKVPEQKAEFYKEIKEDNERLKQVSKAFGY